MENNISYFPLLTMMMKVAQGKVWQFGLSYACIACIHVTLSSMSLSKYKRIFETKCERQAKARAFLVNLAICTSSVIVIIVIIILVLYLTHLFSLSLALSPKNSHAFFQNKGNNW